MSRPLPLRHPVGRGEAADSWLTGYADLFDGDLGLGQLAETIGPATKHAVSQPRALDLLSDPPAELLAELHAATGHDRNNLRALFLPAPRITGTLLGHVWRPLAWSRYCPRCLHTSKGSRLLAWRQPWTLICERHGTILRDTCPTCDKPVAASTPPLFPRPPGTCVASVGGKGRGGGSSKTCGASLADIEPDLATDAIRDAHHRLRSIVNGFDSDGPPSELHNVTTVALLIIGGHQTTAISTVRTAAHGPGILASAISRLDTGRCSDLDRAHRNDAAGSQSRPVPPTWKHTSDGLQARIAIERDETLRPTERVRYGTITGQPMLTLTETDRTRHLPSGLWADWACRLRPEHISFRSWRTAAAIACALHGTNRSYPETADVLGVDHRANGRHSSILGRILDNDDGARILAAVVSLADYLDSEGSPIDYQRRRGLVASHELLEQRTWTQICKASGIAVGSKAKLRHARLYLYELLTAGTPGDAPPNARHTTTGLDSHTAFSLALPRTAAELLRLRAATVLAEHGIDEPLQWSPPRDAVRLDRLPAGGFSLDEIAASVSAALTPGASAARLADERGISGSVYRTLQTVRLELHSPDPAVDRTKRDLDITALARYRNSGATVSELTEQFAVSKTTINRRLNELKAGDVAVPAPRRAAAHELDLPDDPAELPGDLTRASGLVQRAARGRNGRRHVERFTTIASSTSFRHAADHLGCDPRELQRDLHALEKRLEDDLLVRAGRWQVHALTPLGQQLLEDVLSLVTARAA